MRFARRTSSGEVVAPSADAPVAPQAAGSPDSQASPQPLVLTADMVRGVRFNVSSPQGYFFPQVETFVHQVADVLAEHERRALDSDRLRYDAEAELSIALDDNARLRTEIELFTVQGAPLTNPDGTYVTESQYPAPDAEPAYVTDPTLLAQVAQQAQTVTEHEHTIVTLSAALRARDAEVERLTALLEQSDQAQQALQEHLESVTDHSEAQARYAEELRVWGEQIAADLTQASEDLVQTSQALAASEQALSEAQQALADRDRTSVPVTAPAPAAAPVMPWDEPEVSTHPDLTADGIAPSTAEATPDPYSVTATVSPAAVDSELPPGVALPRRLSEQEYLPAAPGMPLSTGGLPAHVWAPELSEQPEVAPHRD